MFWIYQCYSSAKNQCFSARRSRRKIWRLLLILSWILYIAIFSKHSTVIDRDFLAPTSHEPFHSDVTVSLAIMVLGTKHLSKFFTLTKNILYYQGRIRPGMQGCDLNTATINNEVCTTLAPKQPNPLAIHLITDEESRMVIAKYFEDLHLSNFTIYYYDFGSLTEVYNYAPNELFHPRIHVWRGRCLAWLPSHYCTWIDKYFGRSLLRRTLTKIAWPEILPETVSKVILIDTDVLFNQDIWNLWKHFYRFNATQMIGGVFELTEALKGRMDSPQQPMIGNGFNSGVLLLHLARMRQQRWNEMWREVVRDIAETDKHLAFPDQKIFNIIVYKNRHYFYELPCEWNVLVTRSAPVQVCPVAWIVGVNNRQNCLISPQSGLRLVGVVHHCRKPKPGDVFNETFRNRIPIKAVQLFKNRDLHNTFGEVYSVFEQFNKHCFA